MNAPKLRTSEGDKDDPNAVYNRRDAASYVGATYGTLKKWLWEKKGPRPTKRGDSKQARVVYLKKDLDFYNQNPNAGWEEYP